MPEDLEDMLTDFSLMLSAITLDKANTATEREKCRLACYWTYLQDRILQELKNKND